jgi:hypothetical protein
MAGFCLALVVFVSVLIEWVSSVLHIEFFLFFFLFCVVLACLTCLHFLRRPCPRASTVFCCLLVFPSQSNRRLLFPLLDFHMLAAKFRSGPKVSAAAVSFDGCNQTSSGQEISRLSDEVCGPLHG